MKPGDLTFMRDRKLLSVAIYNLLTKFNRLVPGL